MQTQCPHCDTQFRITESQLNTAEGFVRCGVCKEVFNAVDVASQNHQRPSLLKEENPVNEQTNDNPVTADDKQIPADNTPLIFATDISATTHSATEETAAPNHTRTADDTDHISRDEFDFFNEDDLTSAKSVVPDEFRQSTSSVNLSGLLWSAATLLLIASLFIEYSWFNRHQLSRLPELQVWIDKACLQFDCNNISVRDPKSIKLLSRNVYSHPDNKDALKIDITLKNDADFAQPYPVMQINFSDIRGHTVAARRFLPAEYLPEKSGKTGIIASGDKLSFSMEILDPGKQAKTYEFNFL